MISKLKYALIAAPLLLASAPAFAGQWIVDLGKCPDHLEDILDRREDRRDARVDRGVLDRLEDRRDRRENRRDEARTVCPAASLVFDRHAPGRANPRHRPDRVVLLKRRDRHGDWGFYRQTRNGRLMPARVIEADRRDVRRFARRHGGGGDPFPRSRRQGRDLTFRIY